MPRDAADPSPSPRRHPSSSSSRHHNAHKPPKHHSVLDLLGVEVTSIVAPVSICMALVVALVRILNPEGETSTSAVSIATLAYAESSSDSRSSKAKGALLNALIFVGIVAGMTFALVFFYWMNCLKVIKGYFLFAIFDIFFAVSGVLGMKVLQAFDIHMDLISFFFYLFNFSVVGVIAVVELVSVPLLIKQGYMIVIGVVTAFIFTYIPEWTAWIIIGLMALYDLFAVLTPVGPLQLLLQVLQRNNQPLTALVYEARPANMTNFQRERVLRARAEGGGGGGVDSKRDNSNNSKDRCMRQPQRCSESLPPRPP